MLKVSVLDMGLKITSLRLQLYPQRQCVDTEAGTCPYSAAKNITNKNYSLIVVVLWGSYHTYLLYSIMTSIESEKIFVFFKGSQHIMEFVRACPRCPFTVYTDDLGGAVIPHPQPIDWPLIMQIYCTYICLGFWESFKGGLNYITHYNGSTGMADTSNK